MLPKKKKLLHFCLMISLLMIFKNNCAQSYCPFSNIDYSLKNISSEEAFENIYSKNLCSDSLSSSFLIWIKKNVRKHRHKQHSENIIVIEGEAILYIDEQKRLIKEGDYIFVPANSWHSVEVTGTLPLKVLSIQSPYFDGSDREFFE